MDGLLPDLQPLTCDAGLQVTCDAGLQMTCDACLQVTCDAGLPVMSVPPSDRDLVVNAATVCTDTYQ